MTDAPLALSTILTGDTLRVRVTPKARANRIKPETQPDGSILLRVYVTVVPEDGKANDAVIALLAKALKLPKSAFTLSHGLTSRDKTIKVTHAR